jgi:hypothetical protein
METMSVIHTLHSPAPAVWPSYFFRPFQHPSTSLRLGLLSSGEVTLWMPTRLKNVLSQLITPDGSSYAHVAKRDPLPFLIRSVIFGRVLRRCIMRNRNQRFEAILLAIAIILTIITVTSAVILGQQMPEQKGQVRIEFLKAFLQVVVVIVFGTAAKFVGDAYQNKRIRDHEIQDFRRRILMDLVKAYSQVKQSRRLLRAKGAAETPLKNSESLRDFYYSQMVRLSKSQLELETIRRQLDTDSTTCPHRQKAKWTFSRNKDLLNCVRCMEHYLDGLVTEYEYRMPVIWGMENAELWPEMRQLSDLVGHDCRKFDSFVEDYKKALKIIRDDLLM